MANHFADQGPSEEQVPGQVPQAPETAQVPQMASEPAVADDDSGIASQQPYQAFDQEVVTSQVLDPAVPAVEYADGLDAPVTADVLVSDSLAVPSPADIKVPEIEPVEQGQTADSDPVNDPNAGFTTVFSPVVQSEAAPVARSSEPVISLRNVCKIYPAHPNEPALEDVSLDIYAGEFVFLVGHSGSGKSTFLKLLTRELKASRGKVVVAGQDLTSMRDWKVPYLRRQIGCVFQDFKLLTDKTAYENVAFALECIGKPRSVIKAQVPEVLRLVGLGEKMNSYPNELSGGEQQRVSVARAMVNRPPLLVCDEPTGNLDPAISAGIMKLLERINRTGTTVLMATHDREMVDSMRKRVIALESGHVVRDQERGGYGNYGTF